MKAVVLLSGGMDSAVCLAKIIEEYGNNNVMAVGFRYGQKHQQNHYYAKKIADYFNVKMIDLDIDVRAFKGSDSTLLNDKKIKHESYAQVLKDSDTGIADTYVPFRNGLMLSQVAALAYSQKANYVVYGAHKDDYAGNAYPDTSPAFYKAMNEAINVGTNGKINVIAPLINMDKAGVVKLGTQLGVPFEFTRTCYEGDDVSCGECATCLDRINAFKQNDLVDPIPYAINIDWNN
ncbi:7-cyano-7-deazaguanine synthase QueC [Companilactobacillus allii]|uniref:7-cyano-7-deazaguanine synthase n=1 Tax=Companilactobacillus allii TaxID=1847728 RepID=A0A1P8Q2H7_9LACO|nr:7-cyano-7-deazaguanine synthase QueC [Companilactobacillus allii]APX72070.1 7-cyano-7-deazaguanine synthase QueC [Companilactobacillus allii]USQ69163.1 7-cyano-7-deazaguanine synthase QueC [Companilactobacillus allii]